MSISIVPHKNTIFFYLLLNLAGYDSATKFPKHPLREKIESDWQSRQIPPSFQEFAEFYQNNGKPLHIYNFTQWALFTDDRLEPIENVDDSTYQESAKKLFARGQESMQRIRAEMNFDAYYETLLPSYNQYIQEIANYIQEAGFELKMKNFWQIDFDFGFQVIFNPLMEQNRGNGARYGNQIYAVLGPTAKTKSEQYEFSKSWLWQLLVHEFSHLYVEKLVTKILNGMQEPERSSFQEKLAGIKQHINIVGDFPIVKNSYNSPQTYIEETFIRGLTPLAMMPFAAQKTPQELEDINQKTLGQLSAIGFPFASDVYGAIKEARVENPKASLQEVFIEVVDMIGDRIRSNTV